MKLALYALPTRNWEEVSLFPILPQKRERRGTPRLSLQSLRPYLLTVATLTILWKPGASRR